MEFMIIVDAQTTTFGIGIGIGTLFFVLESNGNRRSRGQGKDPFAIKLKLVSNFIFKKNDFDAEYFENNQHDVVGSMLYICFYSKNCWAFIIKVGLGWVIRWCYNLLILSRSN